MKRILLFSSLLIILNSCGNTCQFNIDRYEVLCFIDVPKLTDAVCISDKDANINLSVWEIDTIALSENEHYMGFDKYIYKYKFEKTNGELDFPGQSHIPEKYKSCLDSQNLYMKEGVSKDKAWTILLDRKRGVLIGYMQF